MKFRLYSLFIFFACFLIAEEAYSQRPTRVPPPGSGTFPPQQQRQQREVENEGEGEDEREKEGE